MKNTGILCIECGKGRLMENEKKELKCNHCGEDFEYSNDNEDSKTYRYVNRDVDLKV